MQVKKENEHGRCGLKFSTGRCLRNYFRFENKAKLSRGGSEREEESSECPFKKPREQGVLGMEPNRESFGSKVWVVCLVEGILGVPWGSGQVETGC